MAPRKMHKKGKGVVSWVKEKLGAANKFLKEKRYVGRAVEALERNPLASAAVNAYVPGAAISAAHKLKDWGYGA